MGNSRDSHKLILLANGSGCRGSAKPTACRLAGGLAGRIITASRLDFVAILLPWSAQRQD